MPDTNADDAATRSALAQFCTTLQIPNDHATVRVLRDTLANFRKAVSADLVKRITELDQTVTQQTHMIEQLHQLVDTVIVQRSAPPDKT